MYATTHGTMVIPLVVTIGQITTERIWMRMALVMMFPYINHGPPDSPIIGGPDRGKSRREHKYIFIAIDPDGDDVKYFI